MIFAALLRMMLATTDTSPRCCASCPRACCTRSGYDIGCCSLPSPRGVKHQGGYTRMIVRSLALSGWAAGVARAGDKVDPWFKHQGGYVTFSSYGPLTHNPDRGVSFWRRYGMTERHTCQSGMSALTAP